MPKQQPHTRADYRHFNFPYLWDGETQSVTEAYGAQATPHVFIFDKERKLQYEGRIDNAQRESIVKIQDARLALDAMLAGKPVATPHTPSFGCSTVGVHLPPRVGVAPER